MITTNDKLDREFQEIGYVFAQRENVEDSKTALKKKAAEYGGDATIDFKVTMFRLIKHLIRLGGQVKFDSFCKFET